MKTDMRVLVKTVLGLAVAALLMLSGCSTEPRYRTSFNLVQPTTIEGRQCTTQCDTNQILCEQNERDQVYRCEENARRQTAQCEEDARRQYRSCMNQAQYGGNTRASLESSCQSILNSSTMNCGYRFNHCEAAGRCEANYRACFSNCGGQVEKHVVCVANCDTQ